ncbi:MULTISPECIES: feruloyl-CoA synthase [unclassified Modicisalibacter]|uniref:feruloyl-CoA synthase n=1 Tax=unclassified Modicisalibacter TaxID=2679913 RepID=UPI001CCDA1A2|nr:MULTISPECIES: feruloyl-CoA synthase [unclassified Modicisalibacter]MBZ9557793.1 feruloyl-CoA synthase [Modicisalibacter sp. R2A 31.J]MBZ9573542.1 feruloyl-CoA synthase [Modicisalibacter sp. MOD 31.J]
MLPDEGRMPEHEDARDATQNVYRLSGPRIDDYPRCLTERLGLWEQQRPEQIFLAQRGEDRRGWLSLTYAQALPLVRRLAQALLDQGLTPERPLMVLSGNDLHHALLACAAMHVGIPYVPVSPSYSLLSSDFAKLRHVRDLVTPGMIFVDDEARFATALAAIADEAVIVSSRPAGRALAFDALAETPVVGDGVERAHARVTPDTIAKLLFTSGSTGMPKAVINTQRMLCSNQEMLLLRLPFLRDNVPVLVDWLPWHHTFGGNTILGMTLHNGGSLYIDDGNPTPEGVQRTVENLLEVSPTFYCNVPKGFEVLVDHLNGNERLRRAFFKQLKMMHFGGAVLPTHVGDALDALSRCEKGEATPMLTGLGSTEACLAFCTDQPERVAGLIGAPVPGLDVKLVRAGNKWEARLKGLNITPGYWRDPERTAEAFDEEGYLCTGDAMRLIDPDHPDKGLLFDGRLSENFKLLTGTWVNVGTLRLGLIEEFAPVAQDVVLVGEGQDYLTGLVVLNAAGCVQQLGGRAEKPLEELAHDEALRAFLAERLAAHRRGKSSSTRVERLLVLDTPLSLDKGEVTDKGSVNQRLVREGYASRVDALYATPPPAEVITPREDEPPRA